MLAAAARMEGKDEEAAMYYEYTLGLYHSTGGQSGFAGELYNLGMARLHLNQVDAARRLFTLSLTEYRKLNNETGMAYNLGGFGAVAAVEGDAERANELYGAMQAALDRAGITLDPDDQQDYDRYSALAARGGNTQSVEAARTRGRALSVGQAADLATRGRR